MSAQDQTQGKHGQMKGSRHGSQKYGLRVPRFRLRSQGLGRKGKHVGIMRIG